jgi:serine/threonine protein kinase
MSLRPPKTFLLPNWTPLTSITVRRHPPYTELDAWYELRDHGERFKRREAADLWLSSLRAANPTLVYQLERLLHQHRLLSEEGFLEEPAVHLPGGRCQAGQTVSVYTLLSLIGQGGMGSVWLAERNDGRFERQVAIKFLSVEFVGRAAEQRFKREGSILASLAHPHIAELVDASVTSTGQPYLVLEYIEGSTSMTTATNARSMSTPGFGFFSTCWRRFHTHIAA